MEQFTLSVPCLFGLEGIAAQELRHMGLSDVAAENGRVLFSGDFSSIIKANLCLRTGERVLLRLGSFPARSFEELFQGVMSLPLERFIPKDGVFPVKGHCLNSQLHSVPDCQAIIKKAAAKRLGEAYHLGWLPETGALYQIQFSIMKDVAEIFLDTTGQGLHKRGYRAVGNDAPLRETLAAAMVQLSHYRGRQLFIDPFCGSGTIAIEAALAAKNRAPGIARSFAAEKWPVIPESAWRNARREALEGEFNGEYSIFASDIDPKAIELAKKNAERAGVEKLIHFEVADATAFSRTTERGVIVTNPPYGERLMEKQEAERLYKGFGEALRGAENWKLYLLSSHTEFERTFGKQAGKKRKLYNGMIKCDLFMYF